MEFIYHNPPRSRRSKRGRKAAKKARRKVSAKQRANWARFAAMAKARAMKGNSRPKRRRGKSKSSGRVVARSTVRATTMPRKSRSGKSRRGRSRAGSSARGFTLNLLSKDMLMDAAGIAAGSLAVPFVVGKVAEKFVRKPDGTVDANKYMIAKAVVGIGLAFIASKVKQPRLARGLATGTLANVAYDLLIRNVPSLAPVQLQGFDYEDGSVAGLIDVGGDGMAGDIVDTTAYSTAA